MVTPGTQIQLKLGNFTTVIDKVFWKYHFTKIQLKSCFVFEIWPFVSYAKINKKNPSVIRGDHHGQGFVFMYLSLQLTKHIIWMDQPQTGHISSYLYISLAFSSLSFPTRSRSPPTRRPTWFRSPYKQGDSLVLILIGCSDSLLCIPS